MDTSIPLAIFSIIILSVFVPLWRSTIHLLQAVAEVPVAQ
jgi:hypothetical protein